MDAPPAAIGAASVAPPWVSAIVATELRRLFPISTVECDSCEMTADESAPPITYVWLLRGGCQLTVVLPVAPEAAPEATTQPPLECCRRVALAGADARSKHLPTPSGAQNVTLALFLGVVDPEREVHFIAVRALT